MNQTLVLKQDPILGSQYLLINDPTPKRIPVKNFTTQAHKVAESFKGLGKSMDEMVELFKEAGYPAGTMDLGLREIPNDSPIITKNSWAQNPEREPWFQGYPAPESFKSEYLNFPKLTDLEDR